MEIEHDPAPHLRVLQKALAKDITIRVHGELEYEKAIKSTEFLFGTTEIEFLNELNDAEIQALFEGVPTFQIKKSALVNGINVVDLLAAATAVFSSKGEAKKMIIGGGTIINRNKITTTEQQFSGADLINDKYLIAQKGKKNYFLIIAE